MGEWETKCFRCKKKLPLSEFNDVDYGYGVYHKSTWCKACDSWMDEERWKQNKKILALWEKLYSGKPKMKGWNEVGEVWTLRPDGSLVLKCKGFVQTEEYKRKEMKKLAYPFGWARK